MSSPRISQVGIQLLRMSSPWIFCTPPKLHIPGVAKHMSELYQMLTEGCVPYFCKVNPMAIADSGASRLI